MDSICLYFQVHQPYRLNEVSFFDLGRNTDYFNDDLNKGILKKVCDTCYNPVCDLFQRLLDSYSDFKLSLSFTGVVIEQLEKWNPDTLKKFKKLIDTGRVEVFGETYSHSLSAFYSEKDFVHQVEKHKQLVKRVFEFEPTTFRNTELSYKNSVASLVGPSFKTILTEGVNYSLNNNSQNQVFKSFHGDHNILLRCNNLSDDISFRFSNEQWGEYPMSAKKYLSWVKKEKGEVVCLCMDLETFGEHHSYDTGIFDFFEEFVHKAISDGLRFYNANELESVDSAPSYSIDIPISWADEGKDLSAWVGNSMQKEAISKLYNLRFDVLKKGDENLMDIWEKLSSSDHFYYMSTKSHADGEVHEYFNPYQSPYNAYIYFMNVISDIKIRLGKIG